MQASGRYAARRSRPRWVRGIASVAVAGLLLAACGGDTDPADDEPPADEPADEGDGDEDDEDDGDEGNGDAAEPDEEWPTDAIRVLVGAAEGGGLDTLARLIQPRLAAELGVDVIVENHAGAQTSIASTIAYNEGDECDVIVHNNFPIFLVSYLLNDVDFTYDDIYPIAATQNQPSVIVVPGDSEYDTIDDLINEARERPGELTASVSAIASTNAIGILEMEDLLGIDVNIIDFDGGAPARQAVLSGEVDFSHTSVFAAMPLLAGGELKMLAAHQTEDDWARFREEVDVLADVPTLREATGDDSFGSNTATYGLTANRTCYEDHPNRHQTLVDAVENVLSDPDYIAQLEELELELSTLDYTPEEYHESLLEQRRQVEEVADDLFG
jgi:putative tricarboxylic transport membrane protein